MTGSVVAARVIRVVTGSSTATLIHAIEEEGLEHRIELPPAEARTITPGQVLVLQWSVHNVPELGTPTTEPAAMPADPIDHEFDIRSESPAPAASGRSILDEFNALLGTPRRKG